MRSSEADQAAALADIRHQRREVEDYAWRADLELVAVIEETAQSDERRHRPGLDELPMQFGVETFDALGVHDTHGNQHVGVDIRYYVGSLDPTLNGPIVGGFRGDVNRRPTNSTRRRQADGSESVVHFNVGANSEQFQSLVEDYQNGTYRVGFTPDAQTTYEVRVSVNDEELMQSRYFLVGDLERLPWA